MEQKPLQGVLLVSDVDGTLITDDGNVPARNLEAITRFRRKGGRFALATGRSVESAQKYIERTEADAPSIIYNGSAIYDFAGQEILWSRALPASISQTLRAVYTAFPDIGMEVFSGRSVYVVNSNDFIARHLAYEKFHVTTIGVAEIPTDCNKALFAAENSRLREVERFLGECRQPGVEYVYSSENYYEVLPAGITKGTAVLELARILGVDRAHIMAIGDYYNDLAMIKNAGVGATPATAPEDVKATADLIVCGCPEGAVADFIGVIEERFGCAGA